MSVTLNNVQEPLLSPSSTFERSTSPGASPQSPREFLNSRVYRYPVRSNGVNGAGLGAGMPASSLGGIRSPKRWHAAMTTYVADWVITITIAGLFYLTQKAHGYWREFSLNDETIQYTFAVHERVPNWALGVIALIAPLLTLPIVNYFTVRSFWDLHISWLGLILSLSITGTVTQVVKVTVGRPRPDFIDRCQPRPGSTKAPVYGLSNASICTQTDFAILKDGFESFFSGHSSLSFAGLGFLSWYIAGKLHLFDRRGHTFKSWVALAPLLGALMVAISRTEDNRHHWQDVTVGSLVGLLFSFFAYRQYFPPLGAQDSHIAYPPRYLRGPVVMTSDGNQLGEDNELGYSDELGGLRRGDALDGAEHV